MMKNLNQQIANFYDTSTQLWLDVWGEHMHQGYYGKDGADKKDHLRAQEDLINELLLWADVRNAHHVLDAGCGVGGSARIISKKFNAAITGYTLSSKQAAIAEQINRKQGLENKITIHVDDMMEAGNTNQQFDLVWSLESAEHIPDKEKLLQLFYDKLQTGGKMVLATWCCRHTPPEFTNKEHRLIHHVQHNYHLPPMISIETYKVLAEKTGFKNIVAADWSKSVVPFWDAVIRSALKWKGITGLLRAGSPAIKGAFALRHMKKGYRTGTIRFGVLHAEKL